MKDRIPPNQYQEQGFPVLHLGPIPTFDPATWDFRAEGLVERPLRLTWEEFRRLPSVVDASDFHCVTGWSRLDNRWEGVRFRAIAELAQVKPQAAFATILAEHGYTTSLPLAELMEEEVLFAWVWEGQPLTPEHGYPLRLVVPQKYAYKSAKWVRGVRFTARQEPGYWEARGYSNTADPWREERYS
ncbi:MAG: sulfite oxidase-like oxidoreductase [Chloroflexi bacterium]|nr:sulfite oxidase-like oxidoreductase [Chloroflexota bacterium]